MSGKAISALKEKTEKLKSVEEMLRKEVAELQERLSQHKLTVSRCDIELSLINDAFKLKFGDVPYDERDSALAAMANLNEIEQLEAELQKERSQTKWMESEVERLSGLVPTKPLEDVNVQDLMVRQHDLEVELQSLKIRNQKREKNIRLAENKITSTACDIRDLQIRLEKKEEVNRRNMELQRKVDELAQETAQIADEYKDENARLHDIQEKLSGVNREIESVNEYIEDNEETIHANTSVHNEFLQVQEQLEKFNEPFLEMKRKHEQFVEESEGLRKNMRSQLAEIVRLIEKVKC